MSIRTSSGIKPIESKIPFCISTDDAEAYLQKRFDAVTEEMRKENPNAKDVHIRLLTLSLSSVFKPMMILMPKSVLESRAKKQNNNRDEAGIFNQQPGDGGKGLKLYKPYHELLKPILYNDSDENMFFNPQSRELLKISMNQARLLKASRKPKIQRVGKNEHEYVCVLVDPIRLFWGMLYSPDDKRDYRVTITETQKTKGGAFNYTVNRVIRKANNHSDDDQELIRYLERTQFGVK